MTTNKKIAVRLAIRQEGNFINAYLAQQHTMDDSLLLGSIAVGAAQDDSIFNSWRELMQTVMGNCLIQVTGATSLSWGEPEDAPEHEKAGNA